jgi:hypothetical protein
MDGSWFWPAHAERTPAMTISLMPMRCRAVAMEFAAHLDEQYVEMRVHTDKGKKIVVVCDKDSIFSIQRHIEQIGRACPEISTWKSTKGPDNLHGSDRRAYEAAMWEGWPAF